MSEATLAATGPLTMAEAHRWRKAFATALEDVGAGAGAAPVRIDLSAAGPFDLCGLQLLLSAQASARRAGRTVLFLDPPQAARDLAERAGATAPLAPSLVDAPGPPAPGACDGAS